MMNLKEPMTFDNIKRRYCVGICLVMECKVYNVIVIVKIPLSVITRTRMLFSTLTIHH